MNVILNEKRGWIQREAVTQKCPGRSKGERLFPNVDDRNTNKNGRSQSTSFKSFGVQRKGKGVQFDSKELQVKT